MKCQSRFFTLDITTLGYIESYLLLLTKKGKKKVLSSFRLYLHSGFVEGFIEENDKAKKKEEEEEGVKRRI